LSSAGGIKKSKNALLTFFLFFFSLSLLSDIMDTVEKEQQETGNKIQRHLRAWKQSIVRKPEQPVNVWHLLTNLNNTQRITFAAGK
jgi:hypothetical protein